MIIDKVNEYIKKHQLIEKNDSVLIALSGGADSVALLFTLIEMGYRCQALHCNFHLRGEESNRDEEFCRRLCSRLDVPISVVDFDTKRYAAENNISIEMAARELRYNKFEEKRVKENLSCIAVGHHRDDVAETMILNLLRGTGIKGLRGILPRNGKIVRPLLDIGRDEIIKYLDSMEESYIVDSTNLETNYTRNKIRLQILPLMREINPSANETLYATANKISESEKIYRQAIGEAIDRVKKENYIEIDKLLSETSPSALLFEILHPMGFNEHQIGNILGILPSQQSGQLFMSNNYELIKDRDLLILRERCENKSIDDIVVYGPGTVEFGEIKLTFEVLNFENSIERHASIALLDTENVDFPLFIRGTRMGDRFTPLGMKGSKLVSDYMTDKKFNLHKRERQSVLTDESGNIIWLIGERISEKCKISENTISVIRVELI